MTGPEVKPVQRAVRIPLKVTNALTDQEVVPGMVCAVMTEQLDAYEQVLYELADFTAMVAGWSADKWKWTPEQADEVGTLAQALWQRITHLADDTTEGVAPDPDPA